MKISKMICPHCNKKIDTDNVSKVDKEHASNEGDPFAPSDTFTQMCKPTKTLEDGFSDGS